MAEYEIMRFLNTITAGDLTVALSEFTARHGRLPHAITVHPGNEQLVADALAGLDHQIPLTPTSGAWSNELWLQTNDTGEPCSEFIPRYEGPSEGDPRA